MPRSFATAYKQLNPDQKLAVDTIDGPVMVLAGPGTGKTQVLSLRIARILEQTDTPTSSILALTFTDAAASEMRARLISLIGPAGYAVSITTFHAFCVALIKEYPEYFPIAKESEPITELERSEILHSLFEAMPLEVLKPINQPLLYVPSAMRAISDLKREGIEPTSYAAIIDQSFAPADLPDNKTAQAKFIRNREKNRELLEVYAAYERALRDSLRYDYEDMILFVVRAFATFPEFLSICQERFLYLLVDEYQDTNTAQNSLVEHLAAFWSESANVFVVGDPHQAIYRFQGASLENTYRFLELYPKAEVVTLKIGYRCPQPIYDAAFSLTRHTQLSVSLPLHLREGLTTQLTAVSQEENGVSVVVAQSQQLEHAFLTQRIRLLLKSGVAPEEIVVLCRTNREVHTVAGILLTQGIICSVPGGLSVLKKPHILGVLTFLQTLLELRSGGAGHELFTVLSAPWLHLPRLSLWTLARQAGKEGVSIYELLAKPWKTLVKITGLTLPELEPIATFMAKIKDWGVTERQQPFPDWFTSLLTEIGYLPWLLQQPEKFTYLAEIQALSECIKQLCYSDHTFGLPAFVRAVSIMQEREIRLDAEYLTTQTAAIEITTAHKAKGREWEYVFVVHSADGVWGNVRKPRLLVLPEAILRYTNVEESSEQRAEERRLYYVALTRAKKLFVATYSQTLLQSGKEKVQLPTQFLTEMQPLSTSKADDELDEHVMEQFLASTVQPKLASTFSPTEKEFFTALLTDFRLSVTALNKYLRDPEEFIRDVLLRLPQAKAPHMAFGSAVHKALEFVFREILEKSEHPSQAATRLVFTRALERELLSKDEFSRRVAYGETLLTAYFQEPTRFVAQPLFIERFFGSGFSSTMLDDIALSGRIDRVDWVDKRQNLVRVIDYKTGKQRSIGDIEGTTKAAELSEREQALPESIRGPYKRQLLFYKLLADLDPTFRPTVTEGTFEFVEPHRETGKISTRTFDLSDDAVEDLKAVIRTVMQEIRDLRFLE